MLIKKLRFIQSSDQQKENIRQGGKISAEECLPGPSHRKKRNAENECLFTWEDVDEFNQEKDEIRDSSKINVDSEKFINYVKNLPEEKRNQLIQLADGVRVTGDSQGLVSKLTNNQKVMSHLGRVGRISGMTMHGMMAKNVLADFLNGNYQGVAINLGFIVGGQGFSKVAQAASVKGTGLILDEKLFLGRSLKAASPFLARGTSAFVIYDLVNQVKEFKNGTEEALVGVIGDSIYLGVDATEIGIEIAEAFEVLEGVSSVTGPIGAAIGAVVFVGTDIYMAVKRVGKIDQIIHLKGNEKFIEGLRAFIGMQPEKYIAELMGEKEVSNQLVKQGLEYLQQHDGIQRYVFPTGKSVVDSCRDVPYKTSVCDSGGLEGRCFKTRTVTRYAEECTSKFEVDLDNTVLLDRRITNIKWVRAKPDNPNGGQLFCLPQGDYEPVPSYGSYLCKSAIGVADLSTNKTRSHTLINLDEGKDYAKGFTNSPNIFVVNNGFKEYFGGNKDDIFIVQGSSVKGYFYGHGGVNTLDLTSFAPEEESIDVELHIGKVTDYYKHNSFGVSGINRLLGRKGKADKVFIACDSDTSDVKFIDGQGGSEEFTDHITIYDKDCPYKMQVVVRPNTALYNYALAGDFDYTIPYGSGSAKIDFLYSQEELNLNNTFTFEYEPAEIKSIDARNVNTFNKISHTVHFKFSAMTDKEFSLTISGARNPVYRLGSNTEIKVGDKGNIYMLQNTNQTVNEVIKNYLPVANRLKKMSFFIQSLLNSEAVVIGSSNYEVIHNNPQHKSHLVGNGGENVYVIDSGNKKLEVGIPIIPEVVIYDLDVEKSLDTIDLRNLVKQARSKLSNSFELKFLKSGKDLLLKATVNGIEPTTNSSLRKIVKHEYFTVRLKDGVNWYNKTHVIVDSVLMKINLDNNQWSLKPLPLVFAKDKEFIVITSQDIEENTELITKKRAGNYRFVRNNDDLIITNAFDAKEDLCSITLSKFYKEPKMETLSIKFADKEIILKDHQKQISTAKDIDVVKKEHKDQVYNEVFNHRSVSSEVNESTTHKHKHRHEQSRHKRHNARRHERSLPAGNTKAIPSSSASDDHEFFVAQNNATFVMINGGTSSAATRIGFRINDLFSWVKSSVGGLFNSRSPLPESNTTQSSLSQVDAQVNVAGTIMLFDLLIRKVTGQKFISSEDKSISLLNARAGTLSIMEEFEQILNETAVKSGISATNLNFNPVPVSTAIAQHIRNGKFSDISKTLYSSAKEACPEFKQTDKFLNCLDDRLQEVLAEKEVELLVGKQKSLSKANRLLEKSVPQAEVDNKPKGLLSDVAIEGSSVRRIRG